MVFNEYMDMDLTPSLTSRPSSIRVGDMDSERCGVRFSTEITFRSVRLSRYGYSCEKTA